MRSMKWPRMLVVVQSYLKGTPYYMSTESITSKVFNSALDIWSLGCILIQMVSEEPMWENFSSITYLVTKLVSDMETPKIPEELSEKRKGFY